MRDAIGGIQRPRPGRRWLAIGLMVLGAAAAIAGGIVTGTWFVSSLKVQATRDVPGRFEVHLASGEWDIYELTGTVSGWTLGPVSYTNREDGPVTIDSTDIRVTGPGGRNLAVHEQFSPTSFQTYTTGSHVFTAVASFDLTASGNYRISVSSTQREQVIVARPPFAGLVSVLGWIIAGFAGVAAFTVGLVLLIRDRDRRRRAAFPLRAAYASSGQWIAPSQQSPEPDRPLRSSEYRPGPSASPGVSSGGAAPGWYPDPSGRHQFRYWNGVTWTEHVSTGGTTSTDPL